MECKEMGCNNKAKDGGGFCVQSHVCGDAACLNRRSGAPEETSYCVMHECKELGCNRQARDSGGYCEQSHACGTARCMERRSCSAAHTMFCTTHECKHPDCWAESKVPGGYCLGHACQRRECKGLRRDDNSDGLCAEHHIRQLEEKVKDAK